jgi:hypothetical protein
LRVYLLCKTKYLNFRTPSRIPSHPIPKVMPKPLLLKQETTSAPSPSSQPSTSMQSVLKFFDCLVGGKALKLTIDQNSPINIISLHQFKKLHAEKFKFFTTDMVPTTIGGFRFAGQCTSKIEINSRSLFINFSVREGTETHVIISSKTAEQLGIH